MAKRQPARKRSTLTNQQRLAVLNSVLGRSAFVQKAGLQFGSKRDTYAAAGYVPQGKVTFDHYWGHYTRGDVAGRIVDMPAQTTWKTPPQVVDNEGKDETPFSKAFLSLSKRLRLWHYFQRIDRLAGLGRYAVLMIGTKGVDDAGLRQPLVAVSKPEDLIYLSVYHEKNAPIEVWETDVQSPRFGLPKVYKLKATSGNERKTFAVGDLLVHASRVIHVAENKLEDDVFGRPRLERVLNRLHDLDKIAASTGEAYWQLVSRILQAIVDKEVDTKDGDLIGIDEALQEMIHDLRRQFTGQGVKLEWLHSDTPAVKDVADFYFSLVSGATGIPKRILFGSEMGELASSQDQANYLGTINERQEQFAEPEILRAFVDRMIAIKALPSPQGGEYQVVWPALFEEPEVTIADANHKRALTAQALTPVGGNPLELVDIDEENNVYLVPRKHDDVLPDSMGMDVDPSAEDDAPEEGAGADEEDSDEDEQEEQTADQEE